MNALKPTKKITEFGLAYHLLQQLHLHGHIFDVSKLHHIEATPNQKNKVWNLVHVRLAIILTEIPRELSHTRECDRGMELVTAVR